MKSCPRCNTTLTESLVGEIHVDGCYSCGGVWFDNQELNTVARTQTTGLAALDDMFAPGAKTALTQTECRCPVCSVALYEFEFPHSPGIRLDACPQCRGIWFDDGELHGLYQRIAESQPTVPTAPSAPSAAGFRMRGRQVAAFLNRIACPKCQELNPSSSLICWACGGRLRGTTAPRGVLCPNCDVSLSPKTYFRINVDVCDVCTGVWLDAGELSSLVKLPPEELERIERDAGRDNIGLSTAWAPEKAMLCPICSVPMHQQEYAYHSGIGLDLCDRCNGVWVGGGKLLTLSDYYAKTLGRP